MGIMTALFTGVSGIGANGLALSVIGDNISNVNTVGFKGSRANFGDILSQTLGGSSNLQVGRGAVLQTVQTLFSQGTLETTGSPLDLAIEGDGFFIARDTNGAQFYTRAGQFLLNKDGNIVNPEGLQLIGYQNGELGAINVSSLHSLPKTTANVDISTNLNSNTAVKDPDTQDVFAIDSSNNIIMFKEGATTKKAKLTTGSYSGPNLAKEIEKALEDAGTNDYTVAYDTTKEKFTIKNDGPDDVDILWEDKDTVSEQILGWTTTDHPVIKPTESTTSDYAAVGFDPNDPTDTSDFFTSITVYDSLGNSHLITIYFRKTAESVTLKDGSTGNRWHWYADVPSSDSTTGETQVGGQGYLEFNTSGALVYDPQEYNDFDFIGGVEQDQKIVLDYGKSIVEGGSGLTETTQFGSPNSVLFQSQDGYPDGSLRNLVVDQNGIMTGIFTNGQAKEVARVALARFIAPDELTKIGGNRFAESSGSGQPIIGEANTSGRGRILANSLEASNVDLADEFVKMIAAQRGFQASARVISSADDMLSELMALKR